ncbi:BlaI/MecI/CopY family transcriptional regulator [Peribacillus castrilensis]|jgi:predicted transcriptional regulator|uniref:BlaI/MecI/CopY family transcriptional regulator n=3 Tax=Peribacillus TaxID=2675229 RepID=A0AAJ1QMY2_9BACI|nr:MULTISPECIES: BlaI/MecI/CopY family transcriptional regulator [Bacillaceae]MBL3643936.1 BlaI/MecI/CopY family transcriptional regulator [Bacillus sp. RHFB]MCD1161766.1 BlaI/MecI/CopY family transcriptional regulator [Peribacillus castrilensis]MCP1096299.1 BlaI/MecI/CopY family transcriptional regulator [Bacillaceae bacterium OS4b]PEF39627.1 transcriptional regulator [Bacillus sp. AFS094228]QYF80565.1 BlaI/MecI/CopY family transcriptional regulator [Brevibacterium sp. PAMC21349]
MNIKNFKYDEVGLNRFFGPLEANIMEYLWDKDEQSIKAVQQSLELDKPINFNTVMTVMNRLVEKGILEKRSEGRLSLFRPVQSKEEFFEEQSKKLTENLLDEFGGAVISHMLDAMKDADQGLIEKLEQKIQSLKKDKL